MKLGLVSVVLFIPLLLAACDQQPPKAPPVPHVGDAKPAAGLFQDQRNALDKAKGVGTQMEDQAQRQREAAEQEGR